MVDTYIHADDITFLTEKIAKLEAELADLKDKHLVLLSGRAELWLENQDMKELIKRALEYRLEDVMRKSDIRKLEQAVEGK